MEIHYVTRNPRAFNSYDAIEVQRFLDSAMVEMPLSARAHERILKVPFTLADLGGVESIRAQRVIEAIPFLSFDRTFLS